LLGSFMDDVGLVKRAPKSTLNKLDSSLGSLARLRSRTDAWNITPLVRKAVAVHAEASEKGIPVADLLSQRPMFGEALDPATSAIASKLAEKPNAVKIALRGFASESAISSQPMLGGI